MAELSKERLEYLSRELKKFKDGIPVNDLALKVLEKKISSLTKEFIDEGNTLAYTTSRRKSLESFIDKQNRNKEKNLNIDYEDMHDIVGIRLVCLTLTDMYEYIKLLRKTDEFEIVEERDYISNPKKSGYKSYHILVKYPVVMGSKIEFIKAEIQLRTIFMDIFAREEHKINYKGDCTEENKRKLASLSKKLAYYDWSLDNQFKVEKKIKEKESEEELAPYRREYEKVSYIFYSVFDKIKPLIEESIKDFKNKDDVLHFVYGIKPIESIRRKMIKRHLECTAEDMLQVRDIVRYKVVCTDEKTAKEYISEIMKKLEENPQITNIVTSDRMDKPKDSGYRGYKINASYLMPFVTGAPVTFEILIRTMFMDAWALHNDVIFTDEEAKEKYKEPFSGLSEALHDAESALEIIKSGSKANAKEKEIKVLELVNKYDKSKKNEE
ncbi:MAG: hypothetical protein IJH20_02250 [Bacilli bacterium]|nr:hypothetical protein [Bacilli bacterium]